MDYRYAELSDLQEASARYMQKEGLRRRGYGVIVFGVLALFIGFDRPNNIFSLGLILIGVFLIIEGIWGILKPSPSAILVHSIALGLVGVWNILIVLLFINSMLILLLGVIQLKWAYNYYKEYHYSDSLVTDISQNEYIQTANEMINDINSMDIQVSNDLIELKHQSTIIRILMMPYIAILLINKTEEVAALSKSDFQLTMIPDENNPNIAIVASPIFKNRFTIEMEYYNRYLFWKGIDIS